MSLQLERTLRVNGHFQKAGTCTRDDLIGAVSESVSQQATVAAGHARAVADLLEALREMGGAPEQQTWEEFLAARPAPNVY